MSTASGWGPPGAPTQWLWFREDTGELRRAAGLRPGKCSSPACLHPGITDPADGPNLLGPELHRGPI